MAKLRSLRFTPARLPPGRTGSVPPARTSSSRPARMSFSDDPLGRVALNARRQFNSAIYASGASPSRLICRAVAPVVVGRPGKAPFWTRLRYSLNALKLQDRNVALARSESSKRSSRLLKNYFRGFSLEILQVAARHSVPALTDLPASASWWPQNNAGTDKVSCQHSRDCACRRNCEYASRVPTA